MSPQVRQEPLLSSVSVNYAAYRNAVNELCALLRTARFRVIEPWRDDKHTQLVEQINSALTKYKGTSR